MLWYRAVVSRPVFYQAYGRDLMEAQDWCRKYMRSGNVKDLTQAWDLYYHVFRRIAKQLPQVSCKMTTGLPVEMRNWGKSRCCLCYSSWYKHISTANHTAIVEGEKRHDYWYGELYEEAKLGAEFILGQTVVLSLSGLTVFFWNHVIMWLRRCMCNRLKWGRLVTLLFFFPFEKSN